MSIAQGAESGLVWVPLGLAGLRVVSQRRTAGGELEVTVMGTNRSATCPRCGRESRQVHDTRSRRKQDLPLWAARVVLVLRKRRFRCRPCARTFTEPDQVCGWRRRSTLRWRETVGAQGCTQPIAHVAAAHGVGPRVVAACVREVAAARLAADGRTLDAGAPLPTPRFLGIDEFARRKGQRYDTILCDLEQRRVLEVTAGRTCAEVTRLLERLAEPERVEAVSMDLCRPFREAVRLVLPAAQVVADHFHVVAHIGKALRAVLRRCARGAVGRTALKGQHALFLRAQERLTDEQAHQRQTLADAFPDLAVAWRAKEALRQWYATATAQTAAAQLDAWLTSVERDGPAELRQALGAFATWRDEILAFFHFLPARITNGFVEGKNHRTKALMRQAYGYRNRDHLRLRVLLGVA